VGRDENGALILKPPKGGKGKVRTVPLHPETGQALSRHIDRYGTTPVRCTCCSKVWHLLFTMDGKLINHSAWNATVWHPALRLVGLTPNGDDTGLHQLRHYFASMLIAGGADAKQVQEFCGHGSITITYDTYGHLFDRSYDKAIEIIGAAFYTAPDGRQVRPTFSEAEAAMLRRTLVELMDGRTSGPTTAEARVALTAIYDKLVGAA